MLGSKYKTGVLKLTHINIQILLIDQLLIHRCPRIVVGPDITHLGYGAKERSLNLVDEMSKFV